MSIDDNKDSPYKQWKRERGKIAISIADDKPLLMPHCRICHRELVLQENNTVYWCENCGIKLTTDKVIHRDRPAARHGNRQGRQTYIISQTQQQRRYGNTGKARDVPGSITEEDIEDLKRFGIQVTRVDENGEYYY